MFRQLPQLIRLSFLHDEEVNRNIVADGKDNTELVSCPRQTGNNVRPVVSSALFSELDVLDVPLDDREVVLNVVLDHRHHPGGHGADVGEVDRDQVGDDGAGEAVEDQAGAVTLDTAAQSLQRRVYAGGRSVVSRGGAV